MTMRRMVRECDGVVMDLRSFSPSNGGCIYELVRLLDSIDLARAVLVIDATTDRRFLESTLTELWQKVATDSPNRAVADPSARLFFVTRPTAGEIRALIGHAMAWHRPLASQSTLDPAVS